MASITLQNIYPAAPITNRGQATQLGVDPKNERIVYGCGNNVFVRSIKNPLDCWMYTEHAHPVTAARFSPSGNYICSGDAAGNVRIWATDNADRTLKLELRPITGPVQDIAWSPDNQRIAVVGDGKDKFAHVFIWDSGSPIGELSGHSKQVLSVTWKPTRPFRIATASEDMQVNFFEGPPFKFKLSHKGHSRFVNCVRFSPDGEKFVSVGSDMKGFIFDAKTGDQIGELASEGGHKGSIYSLSWSPDSKLIMTASADKTVKVWDAATGANVATHTFPESTEYMQVSALWAGETLVSLSLNGELNILNPAEPSKPSRIYNGHNKPITALAFDPSTQLLYSGGTDGSINVWKLGEGPVGRIAGKGHTSSITGLTVLSEEGQLLSCSVDDTVRTTALASGTYGGEPATLDGTPSGISVNPKDHSVTVVITTKDIAVLRAGKVMNRTPAAWTPCSVSVSPSGAEVAIGGKDNKIHIFTLDSDVLTEVSQLDRHRGAVTALAYSPNGALLAAGDANREIIVYDTSDKSAKITGWVFHTSRVTSIDWSADSQFVVSGSLDSNVIVWSVENPTTRAIAKLAHIGGVSAVAFVGPDAVASAGNDCCVKTFKFSGL